jgi:hypothetical protein
MFSWFAPFATLAVVAVLYMVSSGGGKRDAMMKDLNFYLVCVVAVSIIAIIGGARYGTDWLDTGAWVAAAIASAAAVWRWKGSGDG